MVEFLDTWPWSSYPAVMGTKEAPAWLDTDWLLAQFGNRRKQARRRFRDFIREGKGLSSPLQATRHQLLLGDDAFVDQFQEDSDTEELREYSKSQKRAIALSLREFQSRSQRRNEAMANAYRSGAYTMQEIGKHFGVHYMTVSRAVRESERQNAE
jgi:hypothetical protein